MSVYSELGRKVVAVGRNYADHAKELGNAVSTTKPLLFMKVRIEHVYATRQGFPENNIFPNQRSTRRFFCKKRSYFLMLLSKNAHILSDVFHKDINCSAIGDLLIFA